MGPPPGRPLSPGGGPLPDEVGDREAERVGEQQQVCQVRLALGVLPPVDGAVFAADALGELGLGETGMKPCRPDARPDFPSAREQPFGLRV